MKFKKGDKVVPCWCYAEWQLSLVNLRQQEVYKVEETETQNRINIILLQNSNEEVSRYNEDWFSPRAPTNDPDWYASRERYPSDKLAVE